jgi:hypothetical protein
MSRGELMRWRPRVSVTLGVGLVLAGLQAAAPAQARENAPTCTDVPSLAKPFYPGPSASKEYDSTFQIGFHVPYLKTYTPQGMTVWTNWNGHHDDLVLIAMYRKGSRSYLVAFDADSGERYATLQLAEGHLGGMSVAGKYLFAQDGAYQGNEPVRRYRLATLEKAIKKAHKKDSKPFVAMASGTQMIHGASFMTTYDGHLWAGHFDSDEPDKMYEYKISKAGKLSKVGSAWEVPAQTQGVLVLSDRFIFSVSDVFDQGTLVVVTRHHELNDAAGRCFRIPSMGESLARLGDNVLLDFEGGSYKYPQATNRIGDVHVAPLDKVRSLADHLL